MSGSMARSPKIVAYSGSVSDIEPDSFVPIFRQHYPSADITCLNYNEKPDKELLKVAEIVVVESKKFEEYIDSVGNAEWIQLTSAGYGPVPRYVQRAVEFPPARSPVWVTPTVHPWQNILFRGFDPLQRYVQRTGKVPTFRVTRMGGTYGTPLAEYVLASIVNHERRLDAMKEAQKSKSWRRDDFVVFRPLSYLTIGIVGAGDIGCEVAKHCKGFGMKTIGLVRREKPIAERSEFIDEYRLPSSLDSLLAESDVVCNILPSNPDTKEFYKENTFQVCTKKPLFINIGRGDAIKASTIIKSIRNGWLSGAVLDVADPEPLPPESPLWDTPGVIISPHACGFTTEKMVVQLFLRNYAKYLRGEKLEFEVDLSSLL